MNTKERDKIIEEISRRIENANNIDNYDVEFALENFLDWFNENYVY